MSLFDFVHICRVHQSVHRLPVEVLGTVVQQLGDSGGQGEVRREITGQGLVLLGLAVSDLEVEGQLGDEHVGLQPDLVNTGRGQGDGQSDEAHDGSVAFLGVLSVGVLRPQLTQQ